MLVTSFSPSRTPESFSGNLDELNRKKEIGRRRYEKRKSRTAQRLQRERGTRPSDIAPRRITDGLKPVIIQTFTAYTPTKRMNAFDALIGSLQEASQK